MESSMYSWGVRVGFRLGEGCRRNKNNSDAFLNKITITLWNSLRWVVNWCQSTGWNWQKGQVEGVCAHRGEVGLDLLWSLPTQTVPWFHLTLWQWHWGHCGSSGLWGCLQKVVPGHGNQMFSQTWLALEAPVKPETQQLPRTFLPQVYQLISFL